MSNLNNHTIYLAGGCFWGVEEYFSRVPGVLDAVSGYANGRSETTRYELIGQTGHAETVQVTYDASKVSLREILLHFFRIINPLSKNKQGNDVGTQYRTGVYYTDANDLLTIEQVFQEMTEQYGQPLAVELLPLQHFIPAEDYHQDYLKKNPNGYCHINVNQAASPVIDASAYHKPNREELKESLSPEAYAVTQESGTERELQSPLWNQLSLEFMLMWRLVSPLFIKDKFDSACGCGSFSRPISPEVANYKEDHSHNMDRIGVRSRVGDSHLGHVFPDGPSDEVVYATVSMG
ncbi:MAG: peptide-methionine (S)-S-oxide reductase MsrA [Streptococcus salivarius]